MGSKWPLGGHPGASGGCPAELPALYRSQRKGEEGMGRHGACCVKLTDAKPRSLLLWLVTLVTGVVCGVLKQCRDLGMSWR